MTALSTEDRSPNISNTIEMEGSSPLIEFHVNKGIAIGPDTSSLDQRSTERPDIGFDRYIDQHRQ